MSLLMTYDPLTELTSLNDWLEQEFSRFLPYQEDEFWRPAADILENESEFIIKAELPEVDEKDIDMKIEKNVLTLKGERKMENKVEKENYRRMERHVGTFQRSFMIPDSVDVDKVTAHLDRGVMKIVLPKKEETKPRSIKIETK